MATIDNYTININVKGDQDLKSAANSASNLGKSIGDLSSGPLKNMTTVFGDGATVVNNFGEKIGGLSDRANQLALALVGVGMVQYIQTIAQAASKTKDLSEAFGLQISTVLELQAGFQRAGRDGDALASMMTTLQQKALDAADGNLKAKNAFNDLGVSMKDLKTLSIDEVMLKIGKAMEEGKGSAESISASLEVLGKKAKGVPWGDFVDGLERAQGKMGDAANATEEFDRAMKQFEQTTADVRREFMIIITPVVEFFNKMVQGSDNAKVAAQGLAAAMAVFATGTIAAGIKTLVGVVSSLIPAFTGTALATGVATTATGALTTAELAYLRVQQASTAARAQSLAASIAQARATLAETVAIQGDVIATAELTAAKRVLTIASGQLAAAQGAAAAATAGLAVGEAAAGTAAVGAAAGVTTLTTATTALGASLVKFLPYVTAAAAAFALFYSGDLNKGENEQLAEIKKLQDAIGSLPKAQQEAYFKMSADEQKRVADAVKNGKAIKDAMEQATGKKPGNESVLPADKKELDQQAAGRASLLATYEIQTLQTVQAEKRLKLQAELIGMGELEKTQKLAAFDAEQKRQMEIFKLQQQIHQIEVQAANDPEGEGKYQKQLTIMRNQLDIVSKQVDKTAELTTALKAAEQEQAKYLFSQQLTEKSMSEMISIQDQINQLTMTGEQQKTASLNQRIQAEARAEIKRREALLGNGQKLDWLEQIDILHQVEKAYDPIIEKQRELTEKSRDFQTGWSKAYNSYMDDATNAAKRGEQAFNSMTGRMNSAIDNFVETGKFSFGDLTRSILQDMLKIELKAQANKLFGMIGGGGGILSGIASIFGFADGGEPPVNQPSIVGEKGPEIFIPKTAGTIIPNGVGMGQNNVTNNTYITNSISAVDAKSVAQLFAENRKVLLGSVQMAQKEMPYGNR